jgi:hypothetical protein
VALPGREIHVSSWLELMKVLHSQQIVQLRKDEGNHLRSMYVFRGVDDASWELLTSFQRLSKTQSKATKVIEPALLRSFRKYASAGTFDQQSEWYILAVGQHNGLPTRCLDWSTSPLVAAHFACADQTLKKKDGAIWCLDASGLLNVNLTTYPKIKAKLQGKWVYDTRHLEASFSNLDKLDSTAAHGDLMLLWEPPSLDMRIASQSGLLSIMNGATASQNAFLEKHSKKDPDLVVRIIISAAVKSEVRDMLDQNNISERSLFPGLPGLCDWLKRYYGTAW